MEAMVGEMVQRLTALEGVVTGHAGAIQGHTDAGQRVEAEVVTLRSELTGLLQGVQKEVLDQQGKNQAMNPAPLHVRNTLEIG